jgi:hypothetical protein
MRLRLIQWLAEKSSVESFSSLVPTVTMILQMVYKNIFQWRKALTTGHLLKTGNSIPLVVDKI